MKQGYIHHIWQRRVIQIALDVHHIVKA
jgi:hypothetical protein